MFKKELADVLKQTAWFLAAVLALAAGLLGLRVVPRQPYMAVVVPTLQIGLFFWALFLGASVFGRERRQKAMEYALALPYSRRGLLLRLAAARLIVWIGLWAASVIAAVIWTASDSLLQTLGSNPYFVVYGLALFTIAFSLAPLIENFIALCLSSIFVWLLMSQMGSIFLILLGLIKHVRVLSVKRFLPELPVSVSFGLFLNPAYFFIFIFAAAVFISFPKFDIRASAAFKKRYLVVISSALLAFFAAGLILAAITFSSPVFTSFLTPNQKLVEFSSWRIQVRSSSGTKMIPGGAVYSLPKAASRGRIVYADDKGLYVLDSAGSGSLPLYEGREGRPHVGPFWICGEQVLFVGDAARDNMTRTALHVVDLNSPDVRSYRTIAIPQDLLPDITRSTPFGTGTRDGRRFWLFAPGLAKKPLFRVWEDGRVQEIMDGITRHIRNAYFINNLVIVKSAEGMEVFRDHGDAFELAKRFDDNISFVDPWDDRILDQPWADVLYGKHGGKIARLDLKTLEIKDVAELGTPIGAWVTAFLPDRFILLEENALGRTLTLSMIRDDRIERLRVFSDWDPAKPDVSFSLQREGIIIRTGKIRRAYAFPDMKEIIF